MIGAKKVVCIIPARLASTRFPRKMLAVLGGKPLLQWVWEAASHIPYFDEILFAVDSQEVGDWISLFGGRYRMTSEECPSGTDRLIELYRQKEISADIWVNWQGDEPFILEPMIQDLLQTCAEDGRDIWTLKKKIATQEEVLSPHIAKVVCDERGDALYFSRSPIPYYRDFIKEEDKIFYKHIGLYAFSEEGLCAISHLSPCSLEKIEQLEQLRFLFHRLSIRVHETEHEAFGIDLPEHLTKAEAFLKRSSSDS